MLEAAVRLYYQKVFVDPLARALCALPFITPNSISVLSALFGLLVPLALYFQFIWLALALMWFSGYLDTLDGTLARFSKRSSANGSVLDIFCDRVVEASVIIGLFLVAPQSRGLACLLILASSYICITSFLVVGIFSTNTSQKSFHYSPGLIERAEAFIFFSFMMLLPQFFNALSFIYTLLVLWTSFRRLFEFYKQSKKMN